MARDKLSELEKTLADNKMQAIILNQELHTMKVAHKAMKADTKELVEENGALEEEACGLFDKVNNNYYDKCGNALVTTTKSKSNIFL